MAKRSKEKPNKREQPEIVLLLFEGPSDEDALYIPLANIFDEISEKTQGSAGTGTCAISLRDRAVCDLCPGAADCVTVPPC